MEPLSTSPVVMVAVPVIASKPIIKSCVRATGLSLSETVTVRVSVEVLLLLSVTVSVTVLVPISSQSNAVWLKDASSIPQTSLQLASIVLIDIEPNPLPSNTTEGMLITLIFGEIVSMTFTIIEAVETLFSASVAVNVRVFNPSSSHSKSTISAVTTCGSVQLSIAVAKVLIAGTATNPVASKYKSKDVAVSVIAGGVTSEIVIVNVCVFSLP